MQTPTNSGPAASTSIFSSRACMSPAWFSIATLTPRVHDRRPRVLEHARPSTRCAARCPPRDRRRCRARRARWASGRSSRRPPSCRAVLRPCPAPCRTSPTSGRSSACRSRGRVRARRRGRAPAAGCPARAMPRNRISLKCTTLTFHFAAKSICWNGVHFCCAEAVHVDAEAHRAGGLLGRGCRPPRSRAWRRAPSAAAPSVFTNVRRSVSMPSIMLQLSFDCPRGERGRGSPSRRRGSSPPAGSPESGWGTWCRG